MKEQLQVELTDEQVSLFWQQGFLCLDRITTDAEIEWLQVIYDRIINQYTPYTPEKLTELAEQRKLPLAGGQAILVWIASPEMIVPELTETIFFRNACRIAACLLNVLETQILGRVRMYFKPARYGAEMPWHQDAAYPNALDSLKFWMPLDAATPENGCLQFISGSHLGGIRSHRSYKEANTAVAWVTDEVDPTEAVACPLVPGTATVHHSHTLHYSAPNQTAKPRRALVISCRVAEASEN